MAAAVGFVEWVFSGDGLLLRGIFFVRRAADCPLAGDLVHKRSSLERSVSFDSAWEWVK